MRGGGKVVKAGLADAARLAKLHARCFEQAWAAPAFAGLLQRDGSLAYFVRAHAGGDPAGVILLQLAAEEVEILTLAVAPEARRCGLARALLLASAKDAYDQGARAMFLEVAEHNEAARALYEGLGFGVAGRRRAYYRSRIGHYSDALILRASLPLRLQT